MAPTCTAEAIAVCAPVYLNPQRNRGMIGRARFFVSKEEKARLELDAADISPPFI